MKNSIKYIKSVAYTLSPLLEVQDPLDLLMDHTSQDDSTAVGQQIIA